MSNVILHLSDLHFGAEKKDDATGNDRRIIALDALIRYVSQLGPDWRPTIVTISGDIGYFGKDKDYVQAKTWLQKQLNILGLTPDDLVLCPGNHDVDRDAVRALASPPGPDEADKWLSPSVEDHLLKRFEAYMRFNWELGVPPYRLHDHPGHLVGVKSVRGLKFICLNSAWFSKGNSDKGQLWLGLPHIQAIEADGIIRPERLKGDPPCIALAHHPREWLAEAEHSPYAILGRPSTFDYLAERCDLILTGHTHSGPRNPDRVAGRAWHILSGATYDNASHFNQFCLIKVESDGFTFRQFEFDPRATGQPWAPKGQARFLPFSEESRPAGSGVGASKQDMHNQVALLRARVAQFAEREIEKKSRAIQYEGSLPQSIVRDVVAYSQQEHFFLGPDLEIRPSHDEVRTDLQTAIGKSSKTLLIAELGAGKSTLAAQLIRQLVQQGLLALLIPAGKFKGASFDTVRDLIDQISAYVRRHLCPEWSDFDLLGLLKDRVELTVVVDGLDELPPHQGRRLLERSAELVHQWAYVRVVATGRPIEMSGFNYAEWQLVGLPRLGELEQVELFRNIALAQGYNSAEADEQAQIGLRTLQQRSDLSAVANTPLVLRLIHPYLARGGDSAHTSLGDLLHNLLEERVLGWSQRDGREVQDHQFETAFPSASSRARILGRLAAEMRLSKDSRVTRAQLEMALEEEFEGRGDRALLSSQALGFFLRHVLIEEDGSISFPVQPLYECALAAYYFHRLRGGAEPNIIRQGSDWRLVSFLAAYARRANRVAPVLAWLTDYVRRLISEEDNVPAASIIVAEAGDENLALCTLEGFRSLGFRPLKVFGDDGGYSVQCIAKAIMLGGTTAWDWFYSQYLDPTIPANDHVFEFAGDILQAYLIQQRNAMPESVRLSLRSLIPPHLTIDDYRSRKLLASIALIFPDEFAPAVRADLFISLIWRGPLQEEARTALKMDADRGHKQEVLRALEQAVRQGYESSGLASTLWMNISPTVNPPLGILKALLKGGYGQRANPVVQKCWDTWASSIDPKCVTTLLRAWLSSGDRELACTAAVVLFQTASVEWRVLAPPLLRGSFYGSTKADEILRAVIDDGGTDAFRWLVEKFDRTKSSFELPHAAAWRVLLSGLQKLEVPRPDWLCHAVAAMNDYTLSRYPDIRQAFCTLLKGSHSAKYVSALRQQLFDIEPNVRKRTACLLATVFPESETLAFEIALHSDYDSGVSNWEAFAQRLQVGPSVLSYLRESSHKWSGRARVFALLLVYRNGIELSKDEWRTLVDGLLSTHRFLDNPMGKDARKQHNPVLADPRAFENLVETLHKRTGDDAPSRAAWALLRYHSERLSMRENARAKLLTLDFGLYLSEILSEWDRVKNEPEYRKAILAEVEKVRSEGQGNYPLFLLARAFEDPMFWKRVLWHATCADHLSRYGIESLAEWFYRLGTREPVAQKYIGEAAAEYLDDPRLRDRFSVSTREVLALIGHCFNAVRDEVLRDLLLASDRQMSGPLEVCIVARLGGQAPREYHPKKPDLSPIVSMRCWLPEEVSSRLERVLLPSEDIHPEFWHWLEMCVLLGENSEDRLNSYASYGYWGAWFSLLLQFLSEQTINLPRLAALTKWSSPPRNESDEKPYTRLITVRRELYWFVRHNEEWRREFITALRDLGPIDWSSEATRMMLLMMCKAELTDDEITTLFDRMASLEFGFHQENFLEWFVDWIVNDRAKNRGLVLNCLRNGLTTLASHEPVVRDDGLVRLVFPSVLWMFGEPPDDDSVNIWLLGLSRVLTTREPRTLTLEDAYTLVEPIWTRIPMDTIRVAVTKGMGSSLPPVRLVTRLVAALGRHGHLNMPPDTEDN